MNYARARKGIVIFMALSFFISGCGYTTRSLLPTKYKTIYVENFTNKIEWLAEQTDQRMYVGYRPGMEIEITNAVINRYLFDGNLSVTQSETPDLILKGALVDYRREPLRYDTNENVEEYRVRLVVDMELIDAKTKNVLWTEKGFAGETTYRTSGSLAKSENTAVRDATNDLATRIVERTIEAW
ncbi:MAG: LPS assembly lipoprotein LptE [Candidatus Omnitrophica bacterium]|nr:LPS assembly lipoprotein LptE [Candidatus Omnitrophota bacterium]